MNSLVRSSVVRFFVCPLAVLSALAGICRAQAPNATNSPVSTTPGGYATKSVPGYVPAVTATLQPAGALPASNVLHLVIGLPRRNQQALDQAMRQIYDPKSIRFHHYLTPAQYRQLFGPTEQDYQAVINFANASGLTVARTLESRMLLGVEGSVAAIEQAFHIHLHTYQHPTEPRQFYAPDADPTVDAALPILDIAGLSDYPEARPMNDGCLCPGNAGGSGPGGTLLGYDFRHAYAPGVTNLGTGQIVGLVEFEGYSTNDIVNYEHLAGLPNVPLIEVPIYAVYATTNGSTNGSTSTNNPEPPTDIEMAISMAPGLQNVTVFEYDEFNTNGINLGNLSANFELMVDQMASSNQISQFSCSWDVTPDSGFSEVDPTLDAYLQQMAMQGQSFFWASGDRNAYTGDPDKIGTFSPYLTSVGGTALTMSGGGSNYVSETAWSLYFECDISITTNRGSGGGISSSYPLPLWQQGLATSTNHGSTTMRMIPDVAAAADHVWIIFGGTSNCASGTSAAAPLWAGFMALVNQQAVSAGAPTAGFINPALYLLGTGTSEGGLSYTSCMHDITNGNNTNAASPANYFAVSGYDLCTGWGTPKGSNLITYLTSPETSHGVVPFYTFTGGTDGTQPSGPLAVDTNGTLYGTALAGGSGSNGTIFSISSDGTGFTTLYSFTNGTDGAAPASGVILSGSNLYGTAWGYIGYPGTVFSICTNGSSFTTLHQFAGGSDGQNPLAGLALYGTNLYGGTESGGSHGDGTLFSICTNGTGYGILHQFTGGSDGSSLQVALTLFRGAFFGPASLGGADGYGTIFSLTPSGSLTTLYNFTGLSDGAYELSQILVTGTNLYGTTETNGTYKGGTLFSVGTNGIGFALLHSFETNGNDGYHPSCIMQYGGTLYGNTYYGGDYGDGTLFSIGTNGSNYAILYSFSGRNDGAQALSLMLATNGMLYGTAPYGGAHGKGTIFAFAP